MKKSFIERRKKLLQEYFCSIAKSYDAPIINEFFRPRDSVTSISESLDPYCEINPKSDCSEKNYQSIVQDTSEKMINGLIVNELYFNTKDITHAEKHDVYINIMEQRIPKGSEENLINFQQEEYSGGHWTRKRFRDIKKMFDNYSCEFSLVHDYY